MPTLYLEDKMENELQKALRLQHQISIYRDELYLSTINNIQEQAASILNPNLGSIFVRNCARDIGGEIIRNFFDTSDYNITVDQMVTRIIKFDYNNDYDPLKNNTEAQKSVYNYNDYYSSTLDEINIDLDASQQQLFDTERKKDSADRKSRDDYRDSKRDINGDLYDELSGVKEEKKTIIQNNKEVHKSDLQADHIQSREAATYNKKYIKEKGIEELRSILYSSDNMQMLHASANASKSDVRVCNVNGNIVYKTTKDSDYDKSTDITHKATPKQLAEAACQQWEKDSSPEKIQKLKDKGYLNEDGKVPKSVRIKLEKNIRHSQDSESKVILKNTNYGKVAKDSTNKVKSNIGKIIAGQIIYYAVPPIIYEVRDIVTDPNIKLDNALSRLAQAGKNIGNYVFSHLKDIFKNVSENSLKKFIKTFMDILIGMVKATIKKMLKIIKQVIMSVVDSVKIIITPSSTAAQKADAIFNLFGVTITNIILELLFETIEKGLGIPEFLLSPLQILTSVICTNLVMLVMEKADVFNVRFGFNIEKLEEIFEKERNNYTAQTEAYNNATQAEIEQLLNKVKSECRQICDSLKSFDPYEDSVRETLESVSRIFNMNIDFEGEWQRFLNTPSVVLGA